MNAEKIAERYADSRPGFTLISFGDVGLPYYRIRLRAQVLARKPLPTMEEMILRAVEFGLDEPDNVRGLLGLGQKVFDGLLAELVRKGYVWLRHTEAGSALSLTPVGATVLDEAEEVGPRDFPMEIHFDGLLRDVVPFIGELLEPRRLKERGAREVPPSVARPPELKDLNVDVIAKLALTLQGQNEQVADLLALKRIDRRVRAFRPSTLLVFRADDASQVQPAFVVDDEISEPHENAFARSRLSKKMAIAGLSREGPESLPLATLGRFWSDTAPDQHESAAPDQSSAKSSRILAPQEQSDYLALALATSRTRLVIISPWITDAVIDSDFVDSLRQRLVAGADVFIGWGLNEGQGRAPDADRRARRHLDELQARFRNLRFSKLPHAHPKLLVSDRAFGIVTGFSWLSWVGDPSRTYRDERGVLISDAEVIDRLFDAAIDRFPSQDASA